MSVIGSRGEAGDEDARELLRLQPIHDEPRRRILACAEVGQPSAGQIVKRDSQRFPASIRSEIGHRLAIDIIFTDRQRLQTLGEALCALIDRSDYVQSQIEGRIALAVEAPADLGRALAGNRRK